MLAGSISKVGRLYSLNLRLIDVQTGKIVSTAIEDTKGEIELVITQGIKNSVLKLINNINLQ